MPRILLCFAAIAAFALPCRAEQTSSAFETLIRLNVMPGQPPNRLSGTGYCLSSRRCIPAIRSRAT